MFPCMISKSAALAPAGSLLAENSSAVDPAPGNGSWQPPAVTESKE